MNLDKTIYKISLTDFHVQNHHETDMGIFYAQFYD